MYKHRKANAFILSLITAGMLLSISACGGTVKNTAKVPESTASEQTGTAAGKGSESTVSDNESKTTEQTQNQEANKAIDPAALKCTGDAQQVVIVTAEDYLMIESTVQAYEKVDGKWKQILAPSPASVGNCGFAKVEEKHEGDGRTPVGVYTFGTFFGNKPNPGVKFPYKQTTDNDYWVDDSESKYYNTWQTGPADGKWSSAENLGLTGHVYDYAAVINYNTEERVPGKGSAIFMHIWSGQGRGTGGCVAMAEENLLTVLKWLDPAKKPVIIQGPVKDVMNLER